MNISMEGNEWKSIDRVFSDHLQPRILRRNEHHWLPYERLGISVQGYYPALMKRVKVGSRTRDAAS